MKSFMKNRIYWIDILNILACAGVLILHCTNHEIHNFSGTRTLNWYIGLLTHSLFLWPVCVFFMLTGSTLIKENTSSFISFYIKRIKRIGVPLLGWNIIYMLITILEKDSLDYKMLIAYFIQLKFNPFLWFFIPLISIYLVLPYITLFVLHANKKMIEGYLIIGFICICIIPMLMYFTNIKTFDNLFPMGTNYLFHVILGYYLYHFDLSNKQKNIIYILAVICVILIFICTYYLTCYYPTYYRWMLTYTFAPCTITAMAVYIYIKDNNKILFLFNKIGISYKQLMCFSGLSFGIYLIQGLWFNLIKRIPIIDNNLFIKFVIMYLLCVSSVYFLKKIHYINQIVP